MKPPPPPDSLPHPLTFFLTAAERRAVLRALRTRHKTRTTLARSRALCLALGITPAAPPPEQRPS